jgi:hypothetical protein
MPWAFFRVKNSVSKKLASPKNLTWQCEKTYCVPHILTPTQKNENKPWHCAVQWGSGVAAEALAMAVPVPAGEGGHLLCSNHVVIRDWGRGCGARFAQRWGQAADALSSAACSWLWRLVGPLTG